MNPLGPVFERQQQMREARKGPLPEMIHTKPHVPLRHGPGISYCRKCRLSFGIEEDGYLGMCAGCQRRDPELQAYQEDAERTWAAGEPARREARRLEREAPKHGSHDPVVCPNCLSRDCDWMCLSRERYEINGQRRI